MENTIKIGKEYGVEVTGYSVEQKGYGRQGLYVDLYVETKKAGTNDLPEFVTFENVYVKDVFPNIKEYYMESYWYWDDAFKVEDTETYARGDGDGEYTEDCLFDNVVDMLNVALDGDTVEIDVDDKL